MSKLLGVIVVHHHGGVDWVVPEYIQNYPPIKEEGDEFFEGDNDYARRFLIESEEDLRSLLHVEGHAQAKIRAKAWIKLKKIFGVEVEEV